MASSNSNRLSREDFRRKKELDELRKAGAVPAEVDDEGNMINPHIPSYIAQAPWYLGSDKPGLRHQKNPDPSLVLPSGSGGLASRKVRVRVSDAGRRSWAKGSCENCGSVTHKTKECTERPRARGARWGGKGGSGARRGDDIVVVESGAARGYDGKRDRWDGFDKDSHAKELLKRFEKIENLRRKIKAEELEMAGAVEAKAESGFGSEEEDVDDARDGGGKEDEIAGEQNLVLKNLNSRPQTTVRNIRIREDRAKYLLNIEENAPFYDPKSRSMRANPFPDKDPSELAYAGDAFVRDDQESKKLTELQLFAWEAHERGKADIHPLATPSAAERLFQEASIEKQAVGRQKKSEILERYGGAEHLNAPPKELLLAQSEEYIEYSGDGKVLKGLEAVAPKSKYEEDVLEGNHKSIWGSFWADGKWGYACCHQTIRGSYCTGEAGKRAFSSSKSEMDSRMANLAKKEDKSNKSTPPPNSLKVNVRYFEDDSEAPTEEQMDQYRLKRIRSEDPMSAYIKSNK